MKIAGFEVWNYQENEPVNVVAMSGGKDSTATLLLAIERNTPNLMCVFADTGNEHPTTYAFLDYLDEKLPVPIHKVVADFTRQMNIKADNIESGKTWSDQSEEHRNAHVIKLRKGTGNPFRDATLLHSTFPNTLRRWCTEQLKIGPAEEQIYDPVMRGGHELWVWTGVRADESLKRSMLPGVSMTDMGYTSYRPILTWSADDVFAMHRKHGINPNPLYQLGMTRVGCMPCINCNNNELGQIAIRFPEQVKRIREWENEMNELGGGRQTTTKGEDFTHTFFHLSKVPERIREHHKENGIDGVIEYIRSGDISQLDMWGYEEEDMPICSSIYGLCE